MRSERNSLSFSHSGERSIVGSNVMRCGAALRARSNSQRSWSTVPCGACVETSARSPFGESASPVNRAGVPTRPVRHPAGRTR